MTQFIDAISQDTGISSTAEVKLLDKSDHLYGLESKRYRIYPNSSSVNPIVKVQSWTDPQVPSTLNSAKTTLIENLIIDGQNYTGMVGILLDNVYNCWIRNLTIKNCDVGIKLKLTWGAWTEFSRIQHVRLENVKTGILFTTDGPNHDVTGFPGNSTAFTHIDDVGILLKNDSNAVGIQVGDPNETDNTHIIDPYSAYIRANVWMQSAGGMGLQINRGNLQYGLINLAVEGPSNGVGINVQYDNQDGTGSKIQPDQKFKRSDGSFSLGAFLTCGGISTSNHILASNPWKTNNPIDVKYY